MKPNWSVQNCIKDRVNREADLEWSQRQEVEVPKIKVYRIIRNKVGWWNIINSALKELQP